MDTCMAHANCVYVRILVLFWFVIELVLKYSFSFSFGPKQHYRILPGTLLSLIE